MPRMTEQQFRDYEARMYGKTKSGPAPSDAADDESVLQESIVAACRIRGYLAVRSRMDRATTNQVGVPDIIIAADNRRVIWCECKSKTGKLRPEQFATKVWLEKLGQEYCLCRSLSDFLTILEKSPIQE